MTKRENFIIYGKPGCGLCLQAKALLERLVIPYTYIDITEPDLFDEDRETVNGIIATGYRTMPMIFREGSFIGGYNELARLTFE